MSGLMLVWEMRLGLVPGGREVQPMLFQMHPCSFSVEKSVPARCGGFIFMQYGVKTPGSDPKEHLQGDRIMESFGLGGISAP